ncbi:hypothetical protein DRO19_00380 [Candidatus Bathyarchaeota archaeon]|nr:MAG: hypothetical protein DRO19_00380 [Candidatus Bathyarchaeota archaeon]
MKYRSSIKTSLEILRVLAENKQYAQYDLPKAISKDYRTVLRHLKTLEYNHLIRLEKTEPASKGGKDRKIYTLTTEGLITALILEESWSKIDEIARKHANLLPLIFGKWEFFEKHGLKDLIIQFLRQTVERVSINLLYRLTPTLPETPSILSFREETQKVEREAEKYGTIISEAIEEGYRYSITKSVLFTIPAKKREGLLSFFSVLKKDKELNAFISSEFERLEKQYEEYLKNIRSWRKMWQELPSD